jgi:hypothetical protein
MLKNFFDRTYENIRSQDLFGYRLNFNYSGKGSEFKTILGGIASVWIKIFILFVFMTRAIQMIYHLSPDISLHI